MIYPRRHTLFLSSLLWVVGLGIANHVAADKPAPDAARGRAAYEQHCARCHGLTGQGDGLDAKRLYPRPRDLVTGVYKYRSTASGTAPIDEDLFHTITNGLPGGGMPDWRHLDADTRWQLVYYVKALSTTFEENPPQPISLGQDPGSSHADLELGKQAYEKLGCAACHGALGRGNGTSAPSLVDDGGEPIRPINLTEGWNYRGGSGPQAILTRMLTGINGTPMPSYAEAVSVEEAWQLAYYVQSLQQEARWHMIVRVPYRAEALPEAPHDPRWKAIEPVSVRVRNVVDASGTMTSPPALTTVWLQAVASDEVVRMRLVWDDPSEERQAPADALALVFRPESTPGDVVTLQTWPLRDSPAMDVYAWSADATEAHEALSQRFEPVVRGQTGVHRPIHGATYQDGRWTLVVSRPLIEPALDGAARLVPGHFTPVAFAVWDGASVGQRAVSAWVDLEIPSKPEREE